MAASYAYVTSTSTTATIDSDHLVTVEHGYLAPSVVATGIIEPISNKVELRSKASGIVEKLHVDVGDRVHAGQVLIELDRDQLLAQLHEAKAQSGSCKTPAPRGCGKRGWLPNRSWI